jgi:uncharacterized membrane protein YeaQ/YmgE (transglycosylase-associated protein family)
VPLGRLVLPGRQDMPIWLTIVIGIVAALIGSLIASALGVGETRGVDWIKLIIQVALAAAGVALVAGRYAPGRRVCSPSAVDRPGTSLPERLAASKYTADPGPMRPGLA